MIYTALEIFKIRKIIRIKNYKFSISHFFNYNVLEVSVYKFLYTTVSTLITPSPAGNANL